MTGTRVRAERRATLSEVSLEIGRLGLMVGLPATGKTTYLAALYHGSEEGDVPEALHVARLTGDRTYLNEIRDRWLRCEEAEHTATGQEKEVSIEFLDPAGGSLEVVVPDMSGESFASYWEHRGWPESFDIRVKAAAGVLLFLHPNQLHERQLIEAMDEVLAGLGEDAAQRESGAPDPEPEWSPDTSPDQVKLVDVLQSMARRRPPGAILPIAVVVSAWDVLPPGESPQHWVESRIPLVSQYLEANDAVHPSRIFGISAQGGDIATDRERLLSLSPSERIQVVGDGVANQHDITAPVRWLLSLAERGLR